MIEEVALSAQAGVILSEDETFDQTEAPRVLREYVCGVCHGELSILYAKAHWRVLVVCLEHGNVSKCGRVMRSTVSMEMEGALSKFSVVIRNLPDLWGHPPRRTGTSNTPVNSRLLYH